MINKRTDCEQDLIYLLDTAKNNTETYNAVSNVMKNDRRTWDGFQSGEYRRSGSISNTVFEAWTRRVKNCFFNCKSNYKTKEDMIDRVVDDINWWKENKGLDKNHIDIASSIYSSDFVKVIKENPSLYERWCFMWLDVGHIDDNVLNECLFKLILSDNESVVTKLVKKYKLDINQDVPRNYHLEFGQIETEQYKQDSHSMKLGYFVRSEKMAKTLTKIGFKWGANIGDGVSILSMLQNKTFLPGFISIMERKKIVKFVGKEIFKDREALSMNKVKDLLINSRNQEDVEVALYGADWKNSRGENGENLMHIIAKYAPTFLSGFLTQRRCLALMDKPDNKGRFPFEYFLCFGDIKDTGEHSEKISEILSKENLPKPDWLEVKMLIIENQATYSGVDFTKLSIWKQETPYQFNECLRSNRGKKFMHMLANNFQYKKNPKHGRRGNDSTPYDHAYYGMNISEYVNSYDVEMHDFLRSAKTEDEVKVALVQSWNIYFDNHHRRRGYERERKTEIKVMHNFITELMDRAIEMGLDVHKMKEQAIDNFDEPILTKADFDGFMSSKFKVWDSLLETVEKKALLKVVSATEIKDNSLTLGNVL